MKTSNDHTLLAWGISGPSRGYGSVLAQSPANFLQSRDLVPLGIEGQGPSYGMTNAGLKITLPLDWLNRDISGSSNYEPLLGFIFGYKLEVPELIMGSLNCRKERDYVNKVGIPFQHLGSNKFIRHPKKGLAFLPMDHKFMGTAEVYITSQSSRSNTF
jgi:hypothetical protein